jgi:hypothetical protein
MPQPGVAQHFLSEPCHAYSLFFSHFVLPMYAQFPDLLGAFLEMS